MAARKKKTTKKKTTRKAASPRAAAPKVTSPKKAHKLNELDTQDVEPMSHVLFEGSETSMLRADEPKPSFSEEQALANAPLAGAGHFKVPLVIER